MVFQRKTRKQRIKGGKKIGEGSYGQVFRPPLRCLRDVPQFDSDKYISKVLTYEDLEVEMSASDILKTLDKDGLWSIRADHFCTLGLDQNNVNFNADISEKYQVIYKFGGVDFDHLLLSPEGLALDGNFYDYINDSEMWSKLSKDGFILVARLIKELLPNIRKMNESIFHCDLHFGNIVYDGSVARLIDFGVYKTFEGQHAHIRKAWENRYLDYGVTEDRIGRVMEDLEPLIENDTLITDLLIIYRHLHAIIHSAWGKSEFKNIYKYWRIKNMRAPRTHDALYAAIMDIST
jgi:serine/threonine protein kinase